MEPPSSGRICVIDQSGERLQTAPIEKAAELALASRTDLGGSVSILLTTDEQVRDMNNQYRKVDEPTDVLSFPAIPLCKNAQVVWPLGDIAISVPYARRQATLRNVDLQMELQYLAIHGVLHLLGWDDENESDRALMLKEMERIGRLAGLPPDPEWSSLLHGEVP